VMTAAVRARGCRIEQEVAMSESPERRIAELEGELRAARAEIEQLRKELAEARRAAAALQRQVSDVRDEATKRLLEEKHRRA
jgi:predicted  nucleic acid-binding Zn-ribbon protein